MDTLQISKENAIKAFNAANPETKKVLKKLFNPFNLYEKMTDRIQTFEDVLELTNSNNKDYELRAGETQDELASRKWKLIAFAYNGNKILNARNPNEYKYYVWAKIDKSSGFGLSLHSVGTWYTGTGVGVRLCFLDSTHAKDAFEKFTQIYADMQIN